MKVLIITSFIENPYDIKESAKAADLVICSDGGWKHAESHGIVPDILMGDFDSLDLAKAEIAESVEIISFPPEKDYTDLELAIRKALEHAEGNELQIEIAGAMGGRLDHTIAGIQLLAAYADAKTGITMKDGRNQCFVMQGPARLEIPARQDSYLSIFSLSPKTTGVTFRGVKYPLDNHCLTSTCPLGVSNEFLADSDANANLSFESGTLLIVISRNK